CHCGRSPGLHRGRNDRGEHPIQPSRTRIGHDADWSRCNHRCSSRREIAREDFPMATVFDKLQLKDQKEIVVLNAPTSFEPELARLKGVTVKRSLTGVKDILFSLA